MRIAIVLGVLVLGGAAFFAFFNKNRGPDPRYVAQVEALRSYLDENRSRIEAIGERLDRVSRSELTSAAVSGSAKQVPQFVCWAEHLRGAENPHFEHEHGTLENLRELHGALTAKYLEPGKMGSPPDLDRLLAAGESSPWAVIRILEFREPKITKFAAGGKDGSFEPGRVSFELVLVDPDDGKVLGKSTGSAENSKKIKVRGAPQLLRNDLKSRTELMAKELAKSLIR